MGGDQEPPDVEQISFDLTLTVTQLPWILGMRQTVESGDAGGLGRYKRGMEEDSRWEEQREKRNGQSRGGEWGTQLGTRETGGQGDQPVPTSGEKIMAHT